MRPLIIIGSIMSLLFVSVVGHACESYEECMVKADDQHNFMNSRKESQGYVEQAEIIMGIYWTNRAIAFKLDEISKKMDNK